MYEYQVEALISGKNIDEHCRNYPFATLVSSGEHCNILHYHKNDQLIHNGDMILIDTGCEYECYPSDNTRTVPANGKFFEITQEITSSDFIEESDCDLSQLIKNIRRLEKPFVWNVDVSSGED
jgi:methionine aminopeptidase